VSRPGPARSVADMTGSDPSHVPSGQVVVAVAGLAKPRTDRFGHDGV
jgi:hypothetical protein